MHELTIARNIVSIIKEELQERDQLDYRVSEIYFNAGRLNAVVPESLQYNFDQIKQDKEFIKDASLIIKQIPVTIKCHDCEYETTIDEPVFRCQNCDSRNIEVTAGKKMYIDSIEIEAREGK